MSRAKTAGNTPGEIFSMTSRRPSKAYNKQANVENQKKIIETTVKAREAGMSYGKYVALQYLKENRQKFQ